MVRSSKSNAFRQHGQHVNFEWFAYDSADGYQQKRHPILDRTTIGQLPVASLSRRYAVSSIFCAYQ